MKIWRTCNACWTTKATDTHSEYAIHITFTLQQWLHEFASMLRCRYIEILVRNETWNKCAAVKLLLRLKPIRCHWRKHKGYKELTVRNFIRNLEGIKMINQVMGKSVSRKATEIPSQNSFANKWGIRNWKKILRIKNKLYINNILLSRRKVRFLCSSSRFVSRNKRNIYRIYVVGSNYIGG